MRRRLENAAGAVALTVVPPTVMARVVRLECRRRQRAARRRAG